MKPTCSTANTTATTYCYNNKKNGNEQKPCPYSGSQYFNDLTKPQKKLTANQLCEHLSFYSNLLFRVKK